MVILSKLLTESLIDPMNDFFNIFRIFKFHRKSPQKKIAGKLIAFFRGPNIDHMKKYEKRHISV